MYRDGREQSDNGNRVKFIVIFFRNKYIGIWDNTFTGNNEVLDQAERNNKYVKDRKK